MKKTVLDGAIASEAIEQAQKHSVPVENSNDVQAYIVSGENMEMIRKDLIRRFQENTAEIKRQIGHNPATEDEIREIFPDYAGE